MATTAAVVLVVSILALQPASATKDTGAPEQAGSQRSDTDELPPVKHNWDTLEAARADKDGAGTGREIWKGDCAVCHGTRGEGSFQGPSITESGTAAVDFMVRTGRMPREMSTSKESLPWIRTPTDSPRSSPKYSDDETRSLVEYTGTFISGPAVPDDVDISGADLANGGTLYRAQCASCHQLAGSGGALAYGVVGPSLHEATPTELLEAIRTGPGSMPVYSPEVITDDQATNIAAYVRYLAEPEDRGGFALWHLGPVPEGLVAWVVGLGLIVVLCRWLGKPAAPPE